MQCISEKYLSRRSLLSKLSKFLLNSDMPRSVEKTVQIAVKMRLDHKYYALNNEKVIG